MSGENDVGPVGHLIGVLLTIGLMVWPIYYFFPEYFRDTVLPFLQLIGVEFVWMAVGWMASLRGASKGMEAYHGKWKYHAGLAQLLCAIGGALASGSLGTAMLWCALPWYLRWPCMIAFNYVMMAYIQWYWSWAE